MLHLKILCKCRIEFENLIQNNLAFISFYLEQRVCLQKLKPSKNTF